MFEEKFHFNITYDFLYRCTCNLWNAVTHLVPVLPDLQNLQPSRVLSWTQLISVLFSQIRRILIISHLHAICLFQSNLELRILSWFALPCLDSPHSLFCLCPSGCINLKPLLSWVFLYYQNTLTQKRSPKISKLSFLVSP